MHTAEPHRRQIICQLPADPRGLTITQQKRYYSRCPIDLYLEMSQNMPALVEGVFYEFRAARCFGPSSGEFQ
jgi:hypothetical protein